jgi:phage repressor protein C with HTH and peptisase S24 domain
MSDSQPQNPIVARLEAAGAARKMSRHAISLAAGLDRGFLQKLEERGPKASVRAASLTALADAVGIPVEELLALAPGPLRMRSGQPPSSAAMTLDVPILGVAAGSIIGAFQISGDAIGYVARPPALTHVADAYAVYVNNDSVVPLHNPGDLRFVHPHKPPRAGESVVLQVVGEQGEILAYIKIYERHSGEWVICRQTNPAAEVKFAAKQVRAFHRVLTVNELFNA